MISSFCFESEKMCSNGTLTVLLQNNGSRLGVNQEGIRGMTVVGNGNRSQSQISHHNRSKNQKSDIWLEDLMLDKLDGSNSKGRGKRGSKSKLSTGTAHKVGESHKKNSGDKDRGSVTTVRFDNSNDGGASFSEDSKTLLKPYSNNTKNSPSGRSTYSSLGFEESTAGTVADF